MVACGLGVHACTHTRLLSHTHAHNTQDFMASYQSQSEYFLGALVTTKMDDGLNAPLQARNGGGGMVLQIGLGCVNCVDEHQARCRAGVSRGCGTGGGGRGGRGQQAARAHTPRTHAHTPHTHAHAPTPTPRAGHRRPAAPHHALPHPGVRDGRGAGPGQHSAGGPHPVHGLFRGGPAGHTVGGAVQVG